MVLIDFGDYKIRFDPNEVRISIDGETIDIGVRRNDGFKDNVYYCHNGKYRTGKEIKKEREEVD